MRCIRKRAGSGRWTFRRCGEESIKGGVDGRDRVRREGAAKEAEANIICPACQTRTVALPTVAALSVGVDIDDTPSLDLPCRIGSPHLLSLGTKSSRRHGRPLPAAAGLNCSRHILMYPSQYASRRRHSDPTPSSAASKMVPYLDPVHRTDNERPAIDVSCRMGPTNEHPRTHRAVETSRKRASPHCPKHPHARTTPSRPSSTLSCSGRSSLEQADSGDAADAPNPRESRVAGSVSPTRAIHGPNASEARYSRWEAPNRSVRCRQSAPSLSERLNLPSNSIHSTCGAALPANDTSIAVPLGARLTPPSPPCPADRPARRAEAYTSLPGYL